MSVLLLVLCVQIILSYSEATNTKIDDNQQSCASNDDESGWKRVEFHDTGIGEINWHDHLQFYWNTPILTASSDPEIHPFLQENIFPKLQNLLKILPATDNRFGDIFNISDILKRVNQTQDNEENEILNSFSKLISIYKKRIASWMALYSKGQCVIDTDLNSLYLLVLSPGEVIPLHGAFNFFVNNIEHESHDLISFMSIQPESFYNKNNGEADDGLFIYDPRGTASGYGFANVFIHTSQHEKLNTRGGYLHIFPSGMKFNTLPVEYTRVFIVSFAKLYSIHQPYRKHEDEDDANHNVAIPVHHIQKEQPTYMPKNDEPFFDQNIQFFSSFGTPIFRSSLKHSSLSIPEIKIDHSTFRKLSKCFTSYSSRIESVHKSNRGGWQSKANIFENYKNIDFIVSGEKHKELNQECHDNIEILYDYLIEQISLWILSFSNSYYFDDNGLIINFQTNNNNKILIDIHDSWININKGIAMNMPHSHPNSDLSGAVYIDFPNDTKEPFDGSVYYDDPRTNLFDNNMHLPFGQFNEPMNIVPKIGDVILFPSWLMHWTMPTYSTNPRISFPFNVRFQGKSQKKQNTDESLIFLKRNL